MLLLKKYQLYEGTEKSLVNFKLNRKISNKLKKRSSEQNSKKSFILKCCSYNGSVITSKFIDCIGIKYLKFINSLIKNSCIKKLNLIGTYEYELCANVLKKSYFLNIGKELCI